MFEIIGLMIGTAILFAIAAVASVVLSGVTWLIIRKKKMARVRLISFAASIPILSAAYMWLCVAFLPHESLFGDIDQPLPNGYALKALGKMPEFASIEGPKSPTSFNGLTEYVGKIDIDGPFVVGQYSHPFATFDKNPNEPFFLFDTRTGKNIDLPTAADLQGKLGHPVRLTEAQFFRSREPSYLREQRWITGVEFGPPAFAVLSLFAFALRAPFGNRVELPQV